MLPFSREVYYSLFAQLNADHALAIIAGAIVSCILAALVLRPTVTRGATATLAAGLALLWAGSAYFWYFKTFAGINFLAPVYGWMAIAQAFLMIGILLSNRSNTGEQRRPRTALIFILFAILWPAIDLCLGPGWPQVRAPGLYPLPLVFLTFAALIQWPKKVAALLGFIPVLFTGVFAYQAYVLGLLSDWLPLAAAIAFVCLFFCNRLSINNS